MRLQLKFSCMYYIQKKRLLSRHCVLLLVAVAYGKVLDNITYYKTKEEHFWQTSEQLMNKCL